MAAISAALLLATGLGLWATVGQAGGPEPIRLALSGTAGTLTVDPSGRAVLSFEQIAPPPPGLVYEIGVRAEGKDQPAGSFNRGGRNVVATVGRAVGPGASVIVRLGRRIIARATAPLGG